MLAPPCPRCKKSFIQRVKCPTCGYMITPNDFIEYIELPKYRPFFNETLALGLVFLLFGISITLAAIFGVDGHFSIGVILAIIFFILATVLCFYLGLDKLRNTRSLYDQYHNNPEEYKMMLANVEYAKQINEAAKPTSQELEARRIKQEYLEAVESQQAGEPWRIRYATYPCPRCGHYKVRSANWEDKKLSFAFWGAMSDAIAKSYKCENCKHMW